MKFMKLNIMFKMSGISCTYQYIRKSKYVLTYQINMYNEVPSRSPTLPLTV